MNHFSLLFTLLFFAVGTITPLEKISTISPALQAEASQLPYWTFLCEFIKKKADAEYYSSNPEKYVLIKGCHVYTYLLGSPDEADWSDIMDFFDSQKEVMLMCNPIHQAKFLKNNFTMMPGMELSFNKKSLELPIAPKGYSIKKLDAQLFKKCAWYEMIKSSYGSEEAVLQYCFGVVLCDETDAVVSEAYGLCQFGSIYEIGITTHPSHRNKGFAAITTAYLIQHGLEVGLNPIWSCNCANIGSWKTALHLGFEVKHYFARLHRSNSNENT